MEQESWTEEDLRWDRRMTVIGCSLSAILWGVICGLVVWLSPKAIPILSGLLR